MLIIICKLYDVNYFMITMICNLSKAQPLNTFLIYMEKTNCTDQLIGAEIMLCKLCYVYSYALLFAYIVS